MGPQTISTVVFLDLLSVATRLPSGIGSSVSLSHWSWEALGAGFLTSAVISMTRNGAVGVLVYSLLL